MTTNDSAVTLLSVYRVWKVCVSERGDVVFLVSQPGGEDRRGRGVVPAYTRVFAGAQVGHGVRQAEETTAGARCSLSKPQ